MRASSGYVKTFQDSAEGRHVMGQKCETGIKMLIWDGDW